MKLSIPQLALRTTTEAEAYKFLEDLRWPDGEPTCPHCGSKRKHYFLKPRNGDSRKTRTGTATQRRVWKCADCRKQFSVLTGTIFHGSKIPVRTWVFVVFEMCSSKNGVSAREIERKYDLTPKTAWFMLHRIREAMKREPMAGLLTGRVIADETYIGGKPKYRRHGDIRESVRMFGATDKTPVLSLVSRETGEVRSRALPTVTADTLMEAIADQADPKNTELHTDGSFRYKRIAKQFASHEWVDHQAEEWARDGVTTNQAETYFSQLKRSIDGTHHHVSPEHLPRYLAEFDFRFNTCKSSDTERMARLAGQVAGRRLTYRQPGQA
jgi:transposase-like protein